MDRYDTNAGVELTDYLRKIFEKARRDGWREDDLRDAINDTLGEAGYGYEETEDDPDSCHRN